MKYTMSIAANEDHLKDLIMSDSKMSDMDKKKSNNYYCVNECLEV